MKVLREGEMRDLRYRLNLRRPLVPVLAGVDCVPSYFIVGGLVFVPLSIPFLEHAYGGEHAREQHCPLWHSLGCPKPTLHNSPEQPRQYISAASPCHLLHCITPFAA